MMRIARSVLLCAIVTGSTLLLAAGPTSAASSPASGPAGTIITVTVPSCPSGTPMVTLADVIVIASQSGVVGSGTVSVMVPYGTPTGHTVVVYSGCDNIDNPQTTFLVTAGNTATVATPGGAVTISSPTDTQVTDVASTGIPAGAPTGVSFLYGLVGFTVHAAAAPGFTIQVVLTFPAPVSEYWKYQGGAWSKFAGATFAGNSVTLTLIDGGAGDADGAANGTIVDPGAAGSSSPAGPAAPLPLMLTPTVAG